MIQLTQATYTNKKGIECDASLYLDRVDVNNLALKRGETVLAYFGDVRTAFKRSLNYAIKGSDEALSFENIISMIENMDKRIDTLDLEDLKYTKKGRE